VDDYCWDPEYVHLVGNVPILVEIDHFDVERRVVCSEKDFCEIGQLRAAFGVPFGCEYHEEVSVGNA